MKKRFGLVLCLLLVSLCAFALADVTIDAKNFPDAAFRECVKAFDTDGNGKLSDAELNAVEEIECYEKGITSLKGIEYFPALRTLSCSKNNLTSLDVSQNPALENLYCSDNQLTNLDVSSNPGIWYLICSGNQLKSLDLSNNYSLYYLGCNDNQLKSLDLSKNPNLYIIDVSNNRLTKLDVSKNRYPDWFCCEGNNLKEIDISGIDHLNNFVNWHESDEVDGVLIWGLDTGFRFSVDKGVKVIYAPEIGKAKISAIKPQVYTGKAIKPAVTLKYKGKTLTKGKDYTVSYSNNKKIGTAYVSITGKGQFVEMAVVKFEIIPEAVELSALTAGKQQLTAEWTKGSGGITGYQVEYSQKKDFSESKKKTVKKAATTSVVFKKLDAKTKYYVRVRAYKVVDEKTHYSAWSNVMYKKTK